VIGIVNYGIGNLRSVANALDAVGASFELVTEPARVGDFDKIIVPGVGAFGACMDALTTKGFEAPVRRHAAAGKPLLGICVGMQMLAERGTEFGNRAGLGLIPGAVVQIPRANEGIRLPHVGWNALQITKGCPLLRDLPPETSAYFVHSFHLGAADVADISALVEYGSPVTAAVSRGNVFGMQFHPEKSQMVGLRVLANFAAL
jgi:imidazole glycerol-phosphate synthase subunit HisH